MPGREVAATIRRELNNEVPLAEIHGMVKRKRKRLPAIGWREWVGLPGLGIDRIKAKVDTGARSSSLHAFDIQEFERDGTMWVRFKVHPIQRKSSTVVEVESPLLESRSVRSSSGKATIRPVITAEVSLLGIVWPVEMTLANRDAMGFRMLLGREAIRRRFLVDPGKSYFGGRYKPGTPATKE